MPRSARALPLLLLAFTAPGAAAAAEPAEEPVPAERRLDRVAGLCRAWTTAKYLHPGLWGRDFDWDAAFVAAAEAVDGTSPPERYREIAAAMLGTLDDPATEVVSDDDEADEDKEHEDDEAAETEAAAPAAAEVELVRIVGDGVLLIDLPGHQRAHGAYAALGPLMGQLPAELPTTSGLILDLRFADGGAGHRGGFILERAAEVLVPRPVRGPARRWLVHWGYAPQRGASSGGYRSGEVTGPATEFTPRVDGGSWRVVFLVNERSPLPDLLWALHGAGLAKLVAEGDFAPERMVQRVTVDLGEGLAARIRVVEVLAERPLDAVQVGSEAPPGGEGDAALAAALALLGEEWEQSTTLSAAASAPAVRRPEESYTDPALPRLGLRLLAACRAWGVIHEFYPYLELIGDWDQAFRDSLPAFLDAGDEVAYSRAVLELMAHVADDHTTVSGNAGIDQLLGAATPPLAVRLIEGEVAVVAVAPEVEGVAVGDVVVEVDGEPIGILIERLLPLVPGSRELNRRRRAAATALRGAADVPAVLGLHGAGGEVRRVEVPRSTPRWWRVEPGPAWNRIAPGVGYADLRLLQIHEVEPMLEELGDTDALILDLRGYPNGTGWVLAHFLNVRGAEVGALFRRREVGSESAYFKDSGFFFAQGLPELAEEPYTGEVVVLIDERAISQSEHVALFLEQAAGAVFIGSPTAGANGDITNFWLPGGIFVVFTGHDVRHADGRQLQRVGILPDIAVEPTLAGLRAGRDEVLERALEHLGVEGAP